MRLCHFVLIVLLCLAGISSFAAEGAREKEDHVLFRANSAEIRLAKSGTVELQAFDALGRLAGSFRQTMTTGEHVVPLPWDAGARMLWVRLRTPLGTATTSLLAGEVHAVRLGAARIGEMRLVSGGTYEIGSPSDEVDRYGDEVRHAVVLSPFWIDTVAVLRSDFLGLMGYEPPADSCQGRCPVTGVNWFEAVLYCNARSHAVGWDTVYRYSGIVRDSTGIVTSLKDFSRCGSSDGYRLPAEAELEAAVRAGNAGAWFWGDSSASPDYAWYAANADQGPLPVAMRNPNAWGLYDMAGNVWEWAEDWYGAYGVSGERNPLNDSLGTFRVLRGGCWKSPVTLLRSAYRNGGAPSYRAATVGFRCVRPVH